MSINRCYIYNIMKEFYSALKKVTSWHLQEIDGTKDDYILWNNRASEIKLPHGFSHTQNSNLSQSSSSLYACVWERDRDIARDRSRKKGIVRVKDVIFGIGEMAQWRIVEHTRYERTSRWIFDRNEDFPPERQEEKESKTRQDKEEKVK